MFGQSCHITSRPPLRTHWARVSYHLCICFPSSRVARFLPNGSPEVSAREWGIACMRMCTPVVAYPSAGRNPFCIRQRAGALVVCQDALDSKYDRVKVLHITPRLQLHAATWVTKKLIHTYQFFCHWRGGLITSWQHTHIFFFPRPISTQTCFVLF